MYCIHQVLRPTRTATIPTQPAWRVFSPQLWRPVVAAREKGDGLKVWVGGGLLLGIKELNSFAFYQKEQLFPVLGHRWYCAEGREWEEVLSIAFWAVECPRCIFFFCNLSKTKSKLAPNFELCWFTFSSLCSVNQHLCLKSVMIQLHNEQLALEAMLILYKPLLFVFKLK